jgi:Fe-S oxidoreductase
MLYKPGIADKIYKILTAFLGEMELCNTCCHHDPKLPEKTVIINVCPGCSKRYSRDYPGISTISLWEILSESNFFPFPNYRGMKISILDACPTREDENVHEAIRTLLTRMNIQLVEPSKTRTKGSCCGDSFYGLIPVEQVKEQMKKRASEMPEDDVVVYCVSCVNSMLIGGKAPHYLVDLLFNEETKPVLVDPDLWHNELDKYIENH